MATIMVLVLFVVLIGVSVYWLPKAPFFSETLQQKQRYVGYIGGVKTAFYIISASFVMLLPLNDNESLREKEVKDKSFENAVKAMIDSNFFEVLDEC